MLRYGEHHIRSRYGVSKPISELNDVPLLDEGFILDRDEIANQGREPHSVAPLRFGDMLHIVRDPPTGTERDHDIPPLHDPTEAAPPDSHVDKIANRRLGQLKEK